ncbi:MAG TPA: trypsin-like peptidase domain-containing protein [Thermomicrobiales bacterium]|nr:trypsin-like peptidase domain-containing protein [Thermomicrobiales bacterium]
MNDATPSEPDRPGDRTPVSPPIGWRNVPADRSTRAPRSFLPVGAILGLLLSLMLVGSGVLDTAASTASTLLQSAQSTPAAGSGSDPATEAGALTVEQVAELANPAVVTVITYTDQATTTGQFGQRPVEPGSGEPIALGTGSGFIWDADGHVITNAHVVEGGSSFTVSFYDGTTAEATLIGRDVYADVAVLQLDLADGQTLPAVASIGSSADVAAGEAVVAIGSPYGELTNTVSDGIVGATGRSLPSSAGVYDLADLIQHDAAIYPGNSGGPLLDLDGNVIGINVATLRDTQTGQASGIGFALSIDSVRPLIEQIIADGTFDRPYLGIQTQTTQDGQQGVVAVDDSGPAADALQPGDLITAIDGTDLDFDHPFLNELFQSDPGDSVELTIVRDGEDQTVSVTLGERPADAA